MRQRGFTLIGMLFLVAGLGIALAAVGTVWETAAKREREAELLFVGGQFRQALASYQHATPEGMAAFPKHLEELLLDPRRPTVLRHLRRIYADPITRSTNWGLVVVDGTIRGVHSVSTEKALKTSGFAGEDQAFEGRTSYADWVFGVVATAPPPGRATAPGRDPGDTDDR